MAGNSVVSAAGAARLAPYVVPLIAGAATICSGRRGKPVSGRKAPVLGFSGSDDIKEKKCIGQAYTYARHLPILDIGAHPVPEHHSGYPSYIHNHSGENYENRIHF